LSARTRPDLPPPTPEALAVSAALTRHISAAIVAAGGAIPFQQFMTMALYEPGLGYYSAGATKIGGAGDFVTAPEISPLFGACLARQVAQILEGIGGGEVLEFGAGSGRLAGDLLVELERMDALPEAYCILEVSADLRARQRELLAELSPALAGRVRWLNSLPDDFSGVALANEVLDAMPVALLRKQDAQVWSELHVGLGPEGWCWTAIPLVPAAPLAEYMDMVEREYGSLPAGYTTEVCTGLRPWFTALAAAVTQGGAILIDYGYGRREYYHPDRASGTLLCHYRHRAHADPFLHVGLQDITASVDFTAAAEAAQDAGFVVAGYATQAQFLMSMGLLELLAERTPANRSVEFALAQQVRRLTLPGEMGERFKVLALLRGVRVDLQGFRAGDELHRL
jgi:SAM-dependent MidA family methyltransferase